MQVEDPDDKGETEAHAVDRAGRRAIRLRKAWKRCRANSLGMPTAATTLFWRSTSRSLEEESPGGRKRRCGPDLGRGAEAVMVG